MKYLCSQKLPIEYTTADNPYQPASSVWYIFDSDTLSVHYLPKGTTHAESASEGSGLMADKRNFGYIVFTTRDRWYDKYGLMNDSGEVLIEPKYSGLRMYYGKWVLAQNGSGYYGVLDLNGNEIIGFDYSFLSPINEHYLEASNNKRCGIISITGEVTIPLEYIYGKELSILHDSQEVELHEFIGTTILGLDGKIHSFVPNHTIEYDNNGKCGLLRLYDHKWTINPIWASVSLISKYNKHYLVTNFDGKCGVMDSSGKILIPVMFSSITALKLKHNEKNSDKLFQTISYAAEISGKYRLLDALGESTFDLYFDSLSPYNDYYSSKAIASFRIGSQQGVIFCDIRKTNNDLLHNVALSKYMAYCKGTNALYSLMNEHFPVCVSNGTRGDGSYEVYLEDTLWGIREYNTLNVIFRPQSELTNIIHLEGPFFKAQNGDTFVILKTDTVIISGIKQLSNIVITDFLIIINYTELYDHSGHFISNKYIVESKLYYGKYHIVTKIPTIDNKHGIIDIYGNEVCQFGPWSIYPYAPTESFKLIKWGEQPTILDKSFHVVNQDLKRILTEEEYEKLYRIQRLYPNKGFFYIEDISGEKITSPREYHQIGHGINEGLLQVCDKKNGWGFVDTNWRQVIECKYDNVGVFVNGIASVRLDSSLGHINKYGEFLLGKDYSIKLPKEYDWGWLYGDFIITMKDFFYGCIDLNLKEIYPPCFNMEEIIKKVRELINIPKNDKVAIFRDKVTGLYGLKNMYSEIVVPPVFSSLSENVHSFFINDITITQLFNAKLNGKWGCIDQKGKEVLPFINGKELVFQEGLAASCNSFINELGETIIALSGKYTITHGFYHGIASAEYNPCVPGKENTEESIQKGVRSYWFYSRNDNSSFASD